MATRTAEREQFLADIITGAVEGGTGYWARTLRYRWEGLAAADVTAVIGEQEELEAWAAEAVAAMGRKVTVAEAIEAGKAQEVTIGTVATGIGRIKRGEVSVTSDLLAAIKRGDAENDAGNIDADGADVIVQAGLFGEVVYG